MEVDIDAATDDHQLVGVVLILFPVGDGGLGFEWGLVIDLGPETGLDHCRRSAQGLFRIALDLRLIKAEIGKFVMDLHCIFGKRRRGTIHDRQRFEFDLDRSQGGLGLGAGLSRHSENRITDIANLACAEHRPVGYQVFEGIGTLDVGCGYHPGDARHRLRFLGINGDDPGMGERAAQHRQLERPLQTEIGGEVGGAAGLGHCGGSGMGDPQSTLIGQGVDVIRADLATEEAPGQLNCLDDLGVAGAAAEVAPQGLDDCRSSGSGLVSSRALADMIIPGVQKPHWMAPDRTKASWMRWGFSGVPRPSTVMTSAPSRSAILVRQERTALPLTITMQAPHWPLRSQDCLAPVRRRSSRSRSSRTVFDSAIHSCRTPLTHILTFFIVSPNMLFFRRSSRLLAVVRSSRAW